MAPSTSTQHTNTPQAHTPHTRTGAQSEVHGARCTMCSCWLCSSCVAACTTRQQRPFMSSFFLNSCSCFRRCVLLIISEYSTRRLINGLRPRLTSPCLLLLLLLLHLSALGPVLRSAWSHDGGAITFGDRSVPRWCGFQECPPLACRVNRRLRAASAESSPRSSRPSCS